MPGGLLNLVATGTQNVILTGNPCKTFFKSTYAKYTNFGLQKFRVDFNGQRQLRLAEPSVFTFTMPRYGDLITDTYLVLDLPSIWSPIVPPPGSSQSWEYPTGCPGLCSGGSCEAPDPGSCGPDRSSCGAPPAWRPYEFKWIEDIGTQLIRRVRFTVGSQIIQEYSGQYLRNLVERDFTAAKKKLYYEMTGNVPELNDPASMFPGQGYPSVGQQYDNAGLQNSATNCQGGLAPSIYGRRLYIPLNIWFTMASKMAFPLVSLQYAELQIEIECRPVQELFVIRDTKADAWQTYADAILRAQQNTIDPGRNITPPAYKAADFNTGMESFYRFIQPPPAWNPGDPTRQDPAGKKDLRLTTAYLDRRTIWAADVHLMSTYVFLTDEEVRVFATRPQKYLIRETYTTEFQNITGPTRIWLENSMGMVASWMWYFQRTDVNLRNAWSNYTNWPTRHNPMILWPACAGGGVTALTGAPGAGAAPSLASPPDPSNYYRPITVVPSQAPPYDSAYPVAPAAVACLSPGLAIGIPSHSGLPSSGAMAVEEDCESEEEDDGEVEGKCDYILPAAQTWVQATPATYGPAAAGRGLFLTPEYNAGFVKNIMESWGLILDGKYRENVLDQGVLSLVSKYSASEGDSSTGLYCYNFALKTSPYDFQPSGAMNLSKFSRVEFEIGLSQPPLDPSAQVTTICDVSDNVIGVNKPVWQIYKYSYNLVVMEERYNVLSITSGMAALEWAR